MTLPIVYIHGLFGSPLDFEEMNSILPGHAILFPNHSSMIPSQRDKLDVVEELLKQLHPFTPCILIGYSLGGRLALQLQTLHPALFPKIICLASHLGAQSSEDRIVRRAWEDEWMTCFKTLPKEKALELWYGQPLFNSFRNHPKYPDFLRRRVRVNLDEIAEVFDQTRRSKMEYMIPSMQQAFFLVGEQDSNVLKLYQKHLKEEQYCVIEKAGHCLHIENPITCSYKIQSWLGENEHNRRTNQSRNDQCRMD